MFHDPRNWSLDIQVICDVLLSGGIIGGPYTKEQVPIDLVFCNPDILWRSEFERPRLGQGAFREAFQAVFKVCKTTPLVPSLLEPVNIPIELNRVRVSTHPIRKTYQCHVQVCRTDFDRQIGRTTGLEIGESSSSIHDRRCVIGSYFLHLNDFSLNPNFQDNPESGIYEMICLSSFSYDVFSRYRWGERGGLVLGACSYRSL